MYVVYDAFTTTWKIHDAVHTHTVCLSICLFGCLLWKQCCCKPLVVVCSVVVQFGYFDGELRLCLCFFFSKNLYKNYFRVQNFFWSAYHLACLYRLYSLLRSSSLTLIAFKCFRKRKRNKKKINWNCNWSAKAICFIWTNYL